MKTSVQRREPSVSEVREELHSVLRSARFRQSPQLIRLLRYICTTALMDDAEQITEYTIALDVLGKTENFKEGKDAIVRVEVHRLRKRLAEFYEEEGSSRPIRIVIPTGKYVPQFCFQDHEPEVPAGSLDEEIAPKILAVPHVPDKGSWWKLQPGSVWMACIGLFFFAALPVYNVLRTEKEPFDAFWDPVLASTNQVLLCIGNLSGGHTHPVTDASGNGPLTLKEYHSAASQLVHVADATALAKFAGLIQSKGKRYRIVSQSEATYSELQNNPVVLIGLLNNDWTKRLVDNLRFSVERPGNGKVLIRDRTNPARTDWSIDYYASFLEVSKDYALVLRATDPKTQQMVVAAAGMSIFGTLAATEFVTNPKEIGKLAKAAPRGWSGKNLEVVLSTEVIRGNPGPPVVVATHFW